MRVLGIDPGYVCTGWGIIDYTDNHYYHVQHGTIPLQKQLSLAEKLCQLHQRLVTLINQYEPTIASVEKVFLHRNVDSALKLGQARGTGISVCATQGLSVAEYTPTEIKQAIVGRGHAAKQQVQHMVKVLLNLSESPASDAADALAAAICHAHSSTIPDVLKSRDGQWLENR